MEDPVPRPTIKKAPWPAGVIHRYLLFQVPGWALGLPAFFLIHQWRHFPWWVLPLFFLFWVIKDALLFPLVWPACDVRAGNRPPLVGRKRLVVKALSSDGAPVWWGHAWVLDILGWPMTPQDR